MGQFDWFSSIGATDEAVAVLNDQPMLFTILLVVLVAVILQSVLLWYINYATMKPEQRKAKQDKKDKKKAAKTAKTSKTSRSDNARK
jgi:multisubunit Na+/H+ antiporter MnhG subunit